MKIEEYYKNHKTFIAALESFNDDMQKFRRYFNDRRLTHVEKNILKSKISIRNSKHDEALDFLNVTTENPFILAHLNFQKGTVFNNNAENKKAIGHLQKALSGFEEIKDKKHCFQVLYAIVMTYNNLKDIDQILFHIQLMKKYISDDQFEKACLLRSEAHYYELLNRESMAIKKIDQALETKSKMLTNRLAFFLVSKFLIYFKFKHFEECRQIVEDYKKTKGFVQSANYHFMNILLNHLLDDSPIYVYKKQMKDAIVLAWQMNVIKHLACAEESQAIENWLKLMDENPKLYGAPFEYKGDFCLFKACLEKHLGQKTQFDANELTGSTQEKLKYILDHSTAPIAKEDLAFLLWKEEFEPKVNIRLNKLISRVKASYGLNIKIHKGSVSIDHKKKAA